MIRIRNLILTPDEPEELLCRRAEEKIGGPVSLLRPVRRGVDARKKSDVHFVYTVEACCGAEREKELLAAGNDVTAAPEDTYTLPACERLPSRRPVVVGFGPAGMFAALALAQAGLCPLVLERGEPAEQRAQTVRLMRERGLFNPESNIQFGEGGAGAFSDGKLTTGVKDRRIPPVLRELVAAGAPANIQVDAKPHIGTDLLPGICANLRKKIIALGGEVRFGVKLLSLRTEQGRLAGLETTAGFIAADRLILACGHSARDTFEALCAQGIPMQPKAFAMGVRIEHLQSEINKAQYGPFAEHPALPAADYALACELANGRRCYTFCMCPGGEVVAAAGEEGLLCTNGASPNARSLPNANAALLTALSPADFPQKGILGGMYWQRELERRAYELGGGGYRAPAQSVGAFLGQGHRGFGRVAPSYLPGVKETDLSRLLPGPIAGTLAQALPVFGRRLRGFDAADALLTGPETRSSSPVRMPRDETLQSTGLRGLYPCGEGAGWAGGIMSAAVDGLKCAEALILACNAAE